jgi:Cu/Ag efflux protein CusF
VRGTIVARPAPNLVLVSHEAVQGLGMGAMELMAIAAEPALLDAAGPKPGDHVKLAVRSTDDRLVLLRIERIP